MQLFKRNVSSAALALKYACLEGTVTADARGRERMMEGAVATTAQGPAALKPLTPEGYLMACFRMNLLTILSFLREC